MPASSRELADIVVRVGRQDRDAFGLLYTATSRKLFGIVNGIVNSRSRTDEILQEVYVKVWQKASDFDPDRSSPITWLAVIARNRALDDLRRRGAATETIDDHPDLAAALEDPLDSRERSDRYRAAIECLNRLDAERRDLVLLAYYRGMSREALARRFDRPAATIKTWLHRSLAQLKTCLSS